MTHRLLILGCGGHGRVVADAALECGYDEIAFLDDVDQSRSPAGARILGPMSSAGEFLDSWPSAVAAVGDANMRLALFGILRKHGFQTPNVIHPSAIISRGAVLGNGIVVAAGAIINVGAHIGNAVIVNTGARIDHDCVIGAGSHLAPGVTLSGGVTVGERVWLGTGCAVRQGVKIGSGAVIGVGSAVVSDLQSGLVYAGVPARLLKQTPTS